MNTLLWAERQKLRRSKIVWIALFAAAMSAIIVFAQGQFVYLGARYVDKAGWYMTAVQSLATFYVLPAVIALLGSYMISREEQDDTQKALRLIPVDEARQTVAKLIVTLLCSTLIYALLFLVTFLAEAILHIGQLTFGMFFQYLKMYLLTGIGVFLAVSPVIALVTRMKRGYWLALVFAEIYSFAGLFAGMLGDLESVYPIIAVFNVSGYYEAPPVQILIGVATLMLCGCLAWGILKRSNHVYS